ncbi:hypothetical protein ACH4SP_15135 [Streptomyces sp. NPDC021093]|uniref:hypothetical protein n=1 Tax=Streptomyces sp. NPDC021093 TaxID=3365112 RepID=UPI0037B7BA2F
MPRIRRALSAALATAALLAAPALVPTAAAVPVPAPECGGAVLDWTEPGDAGALYQGLVHSEQHGSSAAAAGFLVHLTLDRFRLETDAAHGTEQWEIRRYFDDPAPSVFFRSPSGDTVLSHPRCEDPDRPTRVTSTTATVEGNETGRLTRAAF